ncbi:hypothetical protein OC846_006387, partial [Tilletia horrida]
TPQASKPPAPITGKSLVAAASAAASSLDPPETPTIASVKSKGIQEGTADTDSKSAEKIAKLEAHILDLTAQVTGLNQKLVQSFERISDLEDDLSDAHARVSTYSVKVAELEKERQEHLAALNTGLLVEKAHVTSEMSKLMERVIEETAQRGKAEGEKEKIEQELDELSASLFNEANKMVAVEKLARARAEEKTNNLEQSLKDTEALMLEQQKHLADLQAQLDERRAAGSSVGDGGLSSSDARDGAATPDSKGAAASYDRRASVGELRPTDLLFPPRSLSRAASSSSVFGNTPGRLDSDTSLSSPVIVTNIVPYNEFLLFIRFLRKQRQSLAPFYNYPLHPKANTGASSGNASESSSSSTFSPVPNPLMASGLGLSSVAGALGTVNSSANVTAGYAREGISPFAAAGLSRHRDYPTLPSNCESMVSISSQLSSINFLKRAQEEDSEPTLRLDLAPALSWLSRRSVQNSILEGTLVIEPVFPGAQKIDERAIRSQHAHLPPAACALCGTGVVNVPIVPLGGDGSSSGAKSSNGDHSTGSSGATSWASSITAGVTGSRRESNNDSNQSSGGGSSPGLSASNSTQGGKSSLPSLFSSLRLGGSKNTASAAAAPNGEGSESVDESNTPTSLPATPVQPAYLPVPTHIFRVNETASQRYLLCPQHCLARLRAACAFWGYIRALERSIVLEGKQPWTADEAGANASRLVPSRPSSAAAMKPEPARPSSEQANAQASSLPARAATPEVSSGSAPTSPRPSVPPPLPARSSARRAVPPPPSGASGASTPTGAGASTPLTESATTAPGTPSAAENKELPPAGDSTDPTPSTASQASSTSSPAVKPTASAQAPPPLPPHPLTAPRTAIPMLSTSTVSKSSWGHASSFPQAALAWEEKVWQEVVKLKEDMWKARIGVREPELSST